jgi:hypothetical protein
MSALYMPQDCSRAGCRASARGCIPTVRSGSMPMSAVGVRPAEGGPLPSRLQLLRSQFLESTLAFGGTERLDGRRMPAVESLTTMGSPSDKANTDMETTNQTQPEGRLWSRRLAAWCRFASDWPKPCAMEVWPHSTACLPTRWRSATSTRRRTLKDVRLDFLRIASAVRRVP